MTAATRATFPVPDRNLDFEPSDLETCLMTETAEKLRSELQTLPADERAELAHFLIHSLEEIAESGGTEAEWEQELARRAEAIRSGCETGEPAEEVFASLRAKYSLRNAG